jgi:O-antigen/teichoic acid export membrane protein
MLKSMVGATVTGYYAAAVRVADLWYMLPDAITASALPVIARAKAQDEWQYEQKLVFLMRTFTILSLGGSLLFSLIAPWATVLIYGPAYSAAAAILSIHIWRAVPIALSSGTGAYLVNEGRAAIILQKTLAQAILTVTLNFWLIPRFEGQGASVSLLIAALIAQVLWDFVDPRLRRLRAIRLHAWFPWWFPLSRVSDRG